MSICGFWIVQGRSKEEIVERFSHAPFSVGHEIEIRQIYEAADFGDTFVQDVRDQETRLREKLT